MDQSKLLTPFILKPTKIYNYTQAISDIKSLRAKYAKYGSKIVSTDFKNVLKSRKYEFDLKVVIHGFVHQKLLEMQKSYEKSIYKEFDRDLKAYNAKLKRENDLLLIGTNKITGNVEKFEESFDKPPSEALFNNEMLHDIYKFLCSLHVTSDLEQEISYLGVEYLKYIERFLKENSERVTIPIKNIEDKISLFVKLKYNREEFNLEVYEGKYVFAEIYVFLRCGLINYIFKIFDKHQVFFENVEPKFRQNFILWIKTRARPTSYISYSKNDDYFKSFLVNLMEFSIDKANYVISSIEDYIWLQLINLTEDYTLKSVIKQFSGYKSKKGLLLVYTLTKQYEKAIEYIYNSDTPIYPSFFIMQELCKKTDSKNLYINFVFLVASKFTSFRRKVELISMMKDSLDNYYQVIPEMIIKTKLFDVLGIEEGTQSFLDKTINEKVIYLLKEKNDKRQLVKLHYIVEDEEYIVSILIDLFIENILTNTNLQEYLEIADFYSEKSYISNIEKLNILKSFYLFMKTPDICTLKKTSLFNQNFDLIDVKFVVEKILKLACEVVKAANDKEMAKKLFKICGSIEMGEECIKYINKQLILYI